MLPTPCCLLIQRDLYSILLIYLLLCICLSIIISSCYQSKYLVIYKTLVVYKALDTWSNTDSIVDSFHSRETADYSYLLFVFPTTLVSDDTSPISSLGFRIVTKHFWKAVTIILLISDTSLLEICQTPKCFQHLQAFIWCLGVGRWV